MKRFLALIISAVIIVTNFSAVYAEDSDSLNISFADAENREYSQQEIETHYGAVFGNSNFKFTGNDGGLTVSEPAGSTDSKMDFNLGNTFVNGTLDVSLSFRADDNEWAESGYNYRYFYVVDSNGSAPTILQMEPTGFMRPAGGNNWWNAENFNKIKKDENGFYNLRFEFTDDIPADKRTSDNEAYIMYIYDLNNNNGYIFSQTYVREAQAGTKPVALSDIKGIRYSTYKNAINKPYESSVTLKSISAEKRVPKVESFSPADGDISRGVGSIKINFNTQVDESTIDDGILFSKENGEEVSGGYTVELASDKKSAVVRFGTLDVTNYVLSVNENLLSADGKAFKASEAYYSVVVEPLKLLNVSQEDGEINSTLGKIELKFNNAIDEATLADGIKFTKLDGSEIVGGAIVSLGDTNDSAVVEFGRLDAGNYVLCISSELKDTNGGSMDETFYYYNVVSSNPAQIDVDFSNLNEREYTSDEIKEMASVELSDNNGFKFEGKNGGLMITESEGKTGSEMKFKCIDAFTEGEIAFDVSIRGENFEWSGSGDTFMYVSVYDVNGKAVGMLMFTPTGITRPTGIGGDYTGNITDAKVDENGYYNIKCVFSDEIPQEKQSESNPVSFCMNVYDKNNSDNCVFTQYYPAAVLSNIEGVVYTTYKNAANKPFINKMTLKSIKATLNIDKIKNTVMYTNADDISPASEELNFIFKENFSEINSENIALLCGDEKVKCIVDVDESQRRVSVKPIDFLKYGTEYCVKFDGALQDYSFVTKGYSNIILGAVKNLNTIDVSIRNFERKNYLVIAEYYGGDGELCGVSGKFVQDTGVSLESYDNADKIKISVFENINGNYVRVSNTFEI